MMQLLHLVLLEGQLQHSQVHPDHLEVVHHLTDNNHLILNNHHLVHQTINEILMPKINRTDNPSRNKILTDHKVVLVHNPNSVDDLVLVINQVLALCRACPTEELLDKAVKCHHHNKVVLVEVVVRLLCVDHLV
jgi:hypothetical protein